MAMLACARLGAPHSVIFGGFSAEALSSRILDADARVVITADGGYRRGAASAAQARTSTRRWRSAPTCARCSWSAAPARTSTGRRVATSGGTTSSVASRRRARGRVLRRRAPAVHHVHRRDDGQAQGHPPHHRRLPVARGDHAPLRLRHQARDRRLLDGGRHRLGHRAQLHRLRPAGQRRDLGHVRGHARRRGPDRWWRIVEELQGRRSSTRRRPPSAP